MITSKMPKIIIFILSLNFFLISDAYAAKVEFNTWLLKFKSRAVAEGISKKVVDDVIYKFYENDVSNDFFKKNRVSSHLKKFKI